MSQHHHPDQHTNYGGSSSAHSGRPGSTPQEKPRIGPYVIVKTLGEGSFGKVKLAVHQTSGQKVALKIISRKKLLTKDMAGRIDREIEFLQLLRHPHIIKLYTVVTTATEIIMVIEYAGRELFDYIVQHGRMTENGARRFFQQIISAVEYCHRHKIAHRDLKPENLLLDDQLNVKIADFGLSNIMQDGNFLKTSCGSPNYAAPEVINGKLYAGPEVDVWSCGVILYVLLCGRLPFDDEFIPTLFKKIAQGQYTIPPYLSPEAANLLRKMLVVNPLQRITVAEIRQDPWFVKDLPEYLRPPKEEFFNTGVDLATIAKNARAQTAGTNQDGRRPPAMHDRGLHESVLGRLGKTMGYATDDVHDALSKKEPNPIKDAYMLVRENQMILNNSRQNNADGMQSFLAQSPPPWTANAPGSPTPFSLHQRHHSRSAASPLTLTDDHLSLPPSVMTSAAPEKDFISILPSSLPEYHRAFMQGQHASEAAAAAEEAGGPGAVNLGKIKPTLPIRSSAKPSPLTPLSSSASAAQQAAAAAANQPRRPRVTRWQFGIRSRNLPLEAIACIYRALKRLGAEWVETPAERDSDNNSGDEEEEHSGSDSGHESEHDDEEEDEEDEEGSQHSGGSYHSDEEHTDSDVESNHSHREHRQQGPAKPPKDPWLINVRFLKTPSTSPTSSPNPSAVDNKRAKGVYVYITIQLYQLERGFYLVDFRCAGYEREGEGKRKAKEEGEEVASPFPFLEIASGLICALAEAGE